MFLARLPLFASLLLVTGCGDVDSDTSATPPNIIFIMADDLGYGDLGSYGQDMIKTPRLDRMAEEGMRFTDHYSGSTVCAPSRCVLMTGLHTGNCRIRGNARDPLQDEDITVAEVLKEAGYTTGLVGKWGLGEEGSVGIPTRQGFDYFFGYLNQVRAHNFYPEFLWRNEEKVPLRNEVVYIDEGYAAGVGSYSTGQVDYSHDLFANEALSFIEDNSNGPFFLYLALTIPHANNEARWNDVHGMEVPDLGEYASRDWSLPNQSTAAMISRMDADVGRILDKLEELNLDENTVVMFTSDNGAHQEGERDPEFFKSSGPLRGIKRALYEGGIRVPMIARWPTRIEAGSTSDHVSAFWDFLPTAAEMAGIDPPPGIDGISFLPALSGQSQPQHEALYWEFHEQGKRRAVREGSLKLIHEKTPDRYELYDLESDIGEQHDLAAEQPETVARLRDVMDRQRSPSPDWPWDEGN